MKKIVITNGVIAGGILILWFLLGFVFEVIKAAELGEVFGYATMIAAMAFVFVGVSQYRSQNNGTISFRKALTVGLYIAGIAVLFYVVGWLIVDADNGFILEYEAKLMGELKASGAPEEEIVAMQEQMNVYKEWNKNIFSKAAITMLEIVPVAVPAPLLAALILKRKQPSN